MTNAVRVGMAVFALFVTGALLMSAWSRIEIPKEIASKPIEIWLVFGIWVIGPPAWFLYDWYRFKPGNKDEFEYFKYSVELASKVWLALALVIGVMLVGAKP